MVAAQQEANSLFLKSDTDRKATPWEHPVHCTVAYPRMASVEVRLLIFDAHLSDKGIKTGWLSKTSHGDSVRTMKGGERGECERE